MPAHLHSHTRSGIRASAGIQLASPANWDPESAPAAWPRFDGGPGGDLTNLNVCRPRLCEVRAIRKSEPCPSRLIVPNDRGIQAGVLDVARNILPNIDLMPILQIGAAGGGKVLPSRSRHKDWPNC